MRKLFLITLLFVMLAQVTKAAEVYYIKTGTATWLPNTVTLNGTKAVDVNGTLYFALEGGLGIYKASNSSMNMLPLERISAIEKIGNRLWIVTRSKGIYPFDLNSGKLSEPFNIHKSTKFGINNNLEAFSDSDTGKIWFSSFLNLDLYDIKTGKWSNLNHYFTDLGIGMPSSHHEIVIDDKYVWISAGSHNESTGGLLKCDKQGEKCEAIRDEFGNNFYPKFVNIHDIFGSREKFWVIPFRTCDEKPGYRIFEYDLKSDKWTIYKEKQLLVALKHIKEVLPEIITPKPISLGMSGNTSEVEKMLSTVLNEYKNSECARSYSFELSTCKQQVVRHRGKVLTMVYALKNPIQYKALIACFGNKALIDTNEGLDVLDSDKMIRRPVKGREEFVAEEGKQVSGNGSQVKVWTYSCWDGDGPRGQGASAYAFNFDKAEIKKIGIEPLLNYDECSRPIPDSCFLSNRKQLTLTSAGLMLTE